MRHEDIEKLIDARNAGKWHERVFSTALSATVEFARVLMPKSLTGIPDEVAYPFYFIKDKSGTYVGAVLDMVFDLHVFVKPEHRQHGHLCNALNDTILPYLYQ